MPICVCWVSKQVCFYLCRRWLQRSCSWEIGWLFFSDDLFIERCQSRPHLKAQRQKNLQKSTGRRTCNSCHFQIEVLWQVVCQKEIMAAPKCSLSLSHIHLRLSLRNSLSVGSWVTLRFLWGKKWLETKSSLPPGS